eukprot:512098_1
MAFARNFVNISFEVKFLLFSWPGYEPSSKTKRKKLSMDRWMKIICIIGWSFLVKINYYNGSNHGNINDIMVITHCLMEKALEVDKNIERVAVCNGIFCVICGAIFCVVYGGILCVVAGGIFCLVHGGILYVVHMEKV